MRSIRVERPHDALRAGADRLAPLPEAPALVPRRVRPQALEILGSAPAASIDPWALVDGSGAPVAGDTISGTPVRVRATLSAPMRLVGVGVWGEGAGTLSILAEHAGAIASVPGLTGVDLSLDSRARGWHELAAGEAPEARDYILEWTSRGGKLGEIELWALGSPPTGPRPVEVADELYTGRVHGSLELAATPSDVLVTPGTPAALVNVPLAVDPRAFERAFLVYELDGLEHFTRVPRSVNGHGGEIAGAPDRMAAPAGLAPGGLQVEEISPTWLRTGANQLRFAPVEGRTYSVRRPRLVLVRADEVRPVVTAKAAALDDADDATAIAPAEARRGFELTFRETVQPHHVAFRIAAPAHGRLLLDVPGNAAGAASVSLDGLSPGWHQAPTFALPPGERVHVRLSDASAAGVLTELRVSASRMPARGAPARLVVSYPLHGECRPAGAYVRGFIDGPPAAARAGVIIDGRPQATGADGAFAAHLPLSPSALAHQSLAVTAIAGGGRSVGVGPCIEPLTAVADVSSQGGRRTIEEDTGAPYGEVVAAGEARVLSFAGATLEIPRGATDADVRVTIRPLAESQVRPMDQLMENVVAGGRGFRFGPRGMVFKKPITVSLPFDAARLKGSTPADVHTFYFDEGQEHWEPVGRLGVARPGVMASVTEHFTDFINATRPLPEHPGAQLNNPTMIKDMRIADPSAGVSFIDEPAASSRGAAELGLAIETPPARHVRAPALKFTYSSDGPNGWLGLGWDLRTSCIEVDTRFGVPLYRGTDLYALDGEQLTGPDPVTGEFKRRVEGPFDRIQRLGTDATSFSWVVTDKDGTRFFYGETAAARLSDPAPDRPPVIFRWELERIEDVFGNRISLSYFRDTGSNGEPWVQLYPQTIAYTSHPSGLPAEYSVNFVLEAADRSDVVISARPGFQVLTRKRLDFVDVKLADQIIRRYDVRYQTGDFGKSLVSSIGLLGLGAGQELYAHTFAYHTAPQTVDGVPDLFAPAQPWGQVQSAGGGPRSSDGVNRSDESLSGGSGSLGIGIGPISLTAGAGGFSGDSRTSLTMFDRHGDGLPDFVDAAGGGSRNLLLGTLPTTGTLAPELVLGLGPDSLGHIARSGWTASGGLDIGGLFSAAASYSRSTAEDTSILSDVNGDGFVDLLASGGGNLSIRLGDGSGNFLGPQSFGQLDLGDIVFGNPERRAAADAKLHRIDPLIRFSAPFAGQVTVTGAVQRLSAFGDGSIARIFQDNVLVWERLLTDGNPCVPAPGNQCGDGLPLTLATGDRIYTELEAVGAPFTEDTTWDPTITFSVDAALAGLREPFGAPIYRFSEHDDFRLVGQPAVPWAASADGTVTVNGSVRKLPTNDDVLIQVVKHDPNHLNPTLLFSQELKAGFDGLVPVAFDAGVLEAESLTFQVVSDTQIDPARVAWSPSVTYTTYCRLDPRTNVKVCGTVSCSFDADGRPVTCQIANDPLPFLPIPGQVIQQDAQVYVPWLQLLPATPTATLVQSGQVTIDGTVQKSATPAPVTVIVQGPNRLHVKRSFAADEVGSFTIGADADLGSGEQLFFTVVSPLDPAGAVTWAPTVNGTPAPVNVRFRDPSFADPVTEEARDPMSGGYHRWFFGDWDGEVAFSEAGIVPPDTGTTSTFMFVVPQRQGTPATPTPLWVGRGDGELIADGLLKPSRLASSTTLVGGGNGVDDLRIAETWNFNLGAGVLGVGVDATTGDTTGVVDFFDVNGDRFADSVFADGVRFNDGGGFRPKTPVDFGFGDLRTIEQRGLRARAGAQGSLINVTDSGGETKAVVSTGFNVGTDYNMSSTRVDFADMNGDGLPDHVSERPGDGAILVRLNLGYKFGAPIVWPTPPWTSHSFGTRADILRGAFGDITSGDVLRLNDTASNSIGAGVDVGIVGGGGGLVFTSGRGLVELADVNGDGLPDQLMKLPDEHNVLRVKLNLGDHFAPEQRWPIPAWDGIDVDPPDFQFLPGGDALTFRRGQEVSFSFSVKVCFFICVGGSAFHSQGPNWAQLALEDIDGDGRVDHVLKVDGNAQVFTKLNQTNKSNLLKTVFRPLGGTIEIDYKREGNRVAPGESPRVDMPQNQWVLASSTIDDGRGNAYQHTFDYHASGVYDRVEREFLGFGHVTTTRVGDGSRVEQLFHNQDYYRKGLAFRTVESAADGKLFLALDVVHQTPAAPLPPITGSFFPAEASRTTSFFEGTTDDLGAPGKQITDERSFDDAGNVVSMIDRGEPGSDDDLIYTVSWRRDVATHITVPERLEARDGRGALLRTRLVSYRADGTIDTFTNVVAGGKDPSGVPYTGDVARSLTWRLAYDPFGNLSSIIDPTGFTLAYEYDPRMRIFQASVIDSFGYRSTSTPDYRFATATKNSDINGQGIERRLDDFGRAALVFGPNELGGTEPTIRYEYGLQPGSSPRPAWAATRNKDDARPGDPLTTVTFVDGMQRVLETKKDAEVDLGGTHTTGMSVSGRLEFDARGRTAAHGQPIFDTGPATAFVDVPQVNPTRFEYDVLSRQRTVTTADGSRTRFDRGFALLDGATFLQETVTDPLGQVRKTLRTARDHIGAISEQNTIHGQLVPLITRYRYNALGELIAATDASGNATAVDLDTVGRAVSVTSPDAGRTELRFDPNGNLGAKETAKLRALGKLIKFEHTFSRLNAIRFPDHPPVTYVYGGPDAAGDAAGNRAGRVAVVQNEAGSKERKYDRLGNLVDELTVLVEPNDRDDSFVQRMRYRYDSLGRLLEMTFPGKGKEVVSYGYDAGGLISSIAGQYTDPRDLDDDTPIVTHYLDRVGYDEFGEKVRMLYGNGVETRYSYDPVMRRLATVDADNQDDKMLKRHEPPRPFERLRYTYDLLGNVLEVRNDLPIPDHTSDDSPQLGPSTQTFTYDNLYQLVASDGVYQPEAKRRFRQSLAITYDAISNIERKDQKSFEDEIHGSKVDVDVIKDQTYSFKYSYGGPRPHAPTRIDQPDVRDPDDVVLRLVYDADGNQVARFVGEHDDPDVTQTFDSEDRLKKVDGKGFRQDVLYDDSGVRTHNDTGPKLNVYVNQNLTLTDEHNFSKHIFAGDLRIATKVEPQTGARPETFFYHSDELQSTHVVSDEKQFLTEHDEYFAGGELWIEEGRHSDELNPRFLFNAKELDDGTGYYYYGARYYDSRIGQWIAPDPQLGEYLHGDNTFGGIYTPRHLGLYSYTLNNPVALRDPMGRAESVAEPGFGESLIPIWGSGRSAVHHFQEGNWGRGVFFTAMAVSDVFLVKTLVTIGGKVVIRGGASLLAREGAGAGGARATEIVVQEGVGVGEAGAGGSWRTIGEKAGGAVEQKTPLSCVPACGEMLSGISQEELAAQIMTHRGADLVNLGKAIGWRGGAVSEEALPSLMRMGGRWAAELKEAGNPIGHLVVVERSTAKRLLIRDPWGGGSTYWMTVEEFKKFWTLRVVIP